MKKLRWGILSTGNIARRLAKALQTSVTGELVAVASREMSKAEAFAKEFPATRAYGSYDDLLADANVDAVYIALPTRATPTGRFAPPARANTSCAKSPPR